MRYLLYHGPVTEAGVRNVETLLTVAVNEGETEVTLCLASHGGDVNAGTGLYNFIQMLPLKLYTHAIGICESIAVTVMLAGERRTAAPLSSFSLHAATYGDGPFKGQISPYTNLISQPFRDKLKWSDADLVTRFSTFDFRMGPEEAKELGLISEITSPKLGRDEQMIPVHIPS